MHEKGTFHGNDRNDPDDSAGNLALRVEWHRAVLSLKIMKSYHANSGAGISGLTLKEHDEPKPGPGEGFAPNTIADANKSTEVLVALSCENRGKVDELVAKSVAAGGRTYNKPQDYGFIYGHGFQDLDGHVWELFYMDPSHIKQS